MSYLFLIFAILLTVLLFTSKKLFIDNCSRINLKIKPALDKMLKIIRFAPIIALGVIFILFLTYFKSKGYVRLSHAWLVVNFWSFSVIFYYIYMELLKLRNLNILLPLIGMIASAFAAIYLTPLKHYEVAFKHMNLIVPNILGACMLGLSYYMIHKLLSK